MPYHVAQVGGTMLGRPHHAAQRCASGTPARASRKKAGRVRYCRLAAPLPGRAGPGRAGPGLLNATPSSKHAALCEYTETALRYSVAL
jgi:hypothetical protein